MMKKICILFLLVFMATSLSLFAGSEKEVEKGELEVAAVLYGHANEGTWDPAAYRGILKVQKDIPFELHVSEGTAVQDAEKIIRSWASKGVDIVYAHSLIYLEQVITVAKQFPKSRTIPASAAIYRV